MEKALVVSTDSYTVVFVYNPSRKGFDLEISSSFRMNDEDFFNDDYEETVMPVEEIFVSLEDIQGLVHE